MLLLAVANLFAEMADAAARSITGPFLAVLGANGLIVGAVAGCGEFLVCAFAWISSRGARQKRLWPIMILGVVVQMGALPALAFVGSWPHATMLIFLARLGQTARVPPHDLRLANARLAQNGTFDVDEIMGHVGAILGPVVIAMVLAWRRSFQFAFAVLAVPGAVAILLLLAAWIMSPDTGRVARPTPSTPTTADAAAFGWYLAGASLVGFGLADFSLIAFHLSQVQILPHPGIAALYAATMASAGIGSFFFRKLFDPHGLIALVPPTLLAVLYAPLIFLGGAAAAVLGAVLWGIALGAHRSAMKVVVARIVPERRRGSATGQIAVAFGLAWLVGSVALGALYDRAPGATALLAAVAQCLALFPLLVSARKLDGRALRSGE